MTLNSNIINILQFLYFILCVIFAKKTNVCEPAQTGDNSNVAKLDFCERYEKFNDLGLAQTKDNIDMANLYFCVELQPC